MRIRSLIFAVVGALALSTAVAAAEPTNESGYPYHAIAVPDQPVLAHAEDVNLDAQVESINPSPASFELLVVIDRDPATGFFQLRASPWRSTPQPGPIDSTDLRADTATFVSVAGGATPGVGSWSLT